MSSGSGGSSRNWFNYLIWCCCSCSRVLQCIKQIHSVNDNIYSHLLYACYLEWFIFFFFSLHSSTTLLKINVNRKCFCFCYWSISLSFPNHSTWMREMSWGSPRCPSSDVWTWKQHLPTQAASVGTVGMLANDTFNFPDMLTTLYCFVTFYVILKHPRNNLCWCFGRDICFASVYVFVCLYSQPLTFRQWTIPSLGLCSRELFGGLRKFFFTLHVIFVSLKKKKFIVFTIACLAVYAVCRRTKQTQCFGRGTQLEIQRKKEGIGDSELSLWCRRCGTAPCPTPARILTKSGWKRIIKGKKSLFHNACYRCC